MGSLGPILQHLRQLGGVAVAKHQFGCRVFQRLLEQSTEEEKTGPDMTTLIGPVIDAARALSVHKMGNYVIQHLLEHGTDGHCSRLVLQLLPDLPLLASHKAASNVTQKLLQFSREEEQRAMAEKLLSAESAPSLEQLAKNKFGCFVVEDLLEMEIAGVSSPVKDRLARAPEAWAAYSDLLAAHRAKQQKKR